MKLKPKYSTICAKKQRDLVGKQLQFCAKGLLMIIMMVPFYSQESNSFKDMPFLNSCCFSLPLTSERQKGERLSGSGWYSNPIQAKKKSEESRNISRKRGPYDTLFRSLFRLLSLSGMSFWIPNSFNSPLLYLSLFTLPSPHPPSGTL